MKTLILIDIQNDFMPGGALEVKDGDAIVPVVNRLQDKFDLVVATQDWHPKNHASFASNHKGKKPFEKIKLHDMEQMLWPDHCVQNTEGASFHRDLNTNEVEAIFRKGTDQEIDSYSGFYDNGHKKSTGLAGYLREREVDELYFCGVAADICVYFSIKDALKEGFISHMIEDATRPWSKDDFKKVKEDIVKLGGKMIKSGDVGG